MTEGASLRGCGTALVTPFNDDRSIDEKALRRFVDFQIAEGIDFLVPCGTTGESVAMSDDELCRVVEIVLETANGRVPVVAGAGGNNTKHVVELARRYEQIGVKTILSVCPYYNKPTQEGLFQHFQEIARATSLAVVLYNVPSRTSVNMLPETVARLAHVPNIIGVKEACGDLSQIAELASLVPQGFKILSGDDSVTLPIISVGGVGLISVASNEAPRKMTALTSAALNGDWEAARALNKELFALMKVNFIESSPGPVKAALHMMGMVKEVYRLPMVPVKAETKERLRAVLGPLGFVKTVTA